MTDLDILVRTQPTPNPLAIKFIVNVPVKMSGKASFSSPQEAEGLLLAHELFKVHGVQHIYLFENVVTITHGDSINPSQLMGEVVAILQTRLTVHDPDFRLPGEKVKKEKKKNLSPEIQQIEEILDRTIRPGLQADGGDIEVISFENNKVTVVYEGACGSCPSSMYGTLDAILSILRQEFHPDVDISVGPEL